MQKSASIPDLLQNLFARGYRLADADIAAMPDEALHANDWRLDLLQQVKAEADGPSTVLVIAVSSKSRSLKLVFVEVVVPDEPFTPMQLLRRLFPQRHRRNHYPAQARVA